MGPGHARTLRTKLGFVLPELVAASARLAAHPGVREIYPAYLATMHGVIRASVPLMETAHARARGMGPGDPVAAGLADYLEAHIAEEAHHDEWLLDDLEVLGHDRASVLARTPSPTVASVVGAQYYWVLHHHPVTLLGYIAVLEGYPPTKELSDDLIARTGYPRRAFRTLLAHAVLDPRHRDDLDALLDALPLTVADEASVGLSALFSVRHLARMVGEVVDAAERGMAAAAPAA